MKNTNYQFEFYIMYGGMNYVTIYKRIFANLNGEEIHFYDFRNDTIEYGGCIEPELTCTAKQAYDKLVEKLGSNFMNDMLFETFYEEGSEKFYSLIKEFQRIDRSEKLKEMIKD